MPAGPISTRRKSCDACVRGKRRCGQQTPRCARCASRNIECYYTRTKSEEHHLVSFSSPRDSCNPSLNSLPGVLERETTASPNLNDNLSYLLDGFDESIISSNSAISDFDVPSTTLPRDRAIYCVNQFKRYPKMLLSDNRTPFIHPGLYNEDVPFPLSIQEAYAVCALYQSKTEASSSFIFRIIESKFDQILSMSGSWTIAEHLAALQSFCLFQIIRLFDGDIRQRSLAEEQSHILSECSMSLQRRTQSRHICNATSWYDWIFAESVRRTLIISWLIQGVYAIMKQNYCYVSGVVMGLPFTAQSALWKAPSAYHWEKACKEKQHYRIEQMDFGELLEKASVEDVDELGLLLMATHHGVDRIREWSGRSGDQLDGP